MVKKATKEEGLREVYNKDVLKVCLSNCFRKLVMQEKTRVRCGVSAAIYQRLVIKFFVARDMDPKESREEIAKAREKLLKKGGE